MFFLPENVFNYLLREDAKPQIKKHKETRQLNECCPISLNPFSPESEVATLLCGHCFEPEALNTWLDKQYKSATPMSCSTESQQKKGNTNLCEETAISRG